MSNVGRWTLGAVVILVVLVVGLLVGVILTKPGNVEAQAAPTTGQYDRRGVTVSGQGIVVLKPDTIKLTIGVDERANTVQEAQQKANTKQDAIKKALTDLKISPDDIQTSDYYISPNYRSDNAGNTQLQGYIVNAHLLVTVRNPADAGKVIDGATTAGSNQISNIQFTLDNNAAALKAAREAAMRDAKAKADQLAGAGNFQVGTVVGVSEQGSNLPAMPVNRVAAGAAASNAASVPTSIETGQFQVQVSVEVTYAIK